MPYPNHNKELTIYEMVLNRLPYVVADEATQNLISDFTLEVMFELEPCFRVAETVTPPDRSRIGNEQYYTEEQRSIIADIVTVYMLMLRMATANSGTEDGAFSGKFLKRAKAGSAEVEYEQIDVKKAGFLAFDAQSLIDRYKKQAIRKAHNLGCIIDICDDCTLAVQAMQQGTVMPFMTSSCGCGCGKKGGGRIPERG